MPKRSTATLASAPCYQLAYSWLRTPERRLPRPYLSILQCTYHWLAWEGPGWDEFALDLTARARHASRRQLAELAFLSLAAVADYASVRRRLATVLNILKDPTNAPAARARYGRRSFIQESLRLALKTDARLRRHASRALAGFLDWYSAKPQPHQADRSLPRSLAFASRPALVRVVLLTLGAATHDQSLRNKIGAVLSAPFYYQQTATLNH
jgi:hypothetical protein